MKIYKVHALVLVIAVILRADTKRHGQFYSSYIIDNCFLLYDIQSRIPNLHLGVKLNYCSSLRSVIDVFCFPKKTLLKTIKKSTKSGLKEIQTHDLAIPVQCSTNWTIKPTGSWPLCEFVIMIPIWRLVFLKEKDIYEDIDYQRYHRLSSYLSPQFKCMIFHILFCKIKAFKDTFKGKKFRRDGVRN